MKKYIQTKVTEDDFKKIKKAAIDMDESVEEFIRQAALDRVSEIKKEEVKDKD